MQKQLTKVNNEEARKSVLNRTETIKILEYAFLIVDFECENNQIQKQGNQH